MKSATTLAKLTTESTIQKLQVILPITFQWGLGSGFLGLGLGLGLELGLELGLGLGLLGLVSKTDAAQAPWLDENRRILSSY